MRLATANHTAEVCAETAVQTAQIKATPQMFKILYDQIYTNKELAVVRELISNAFDAHVRAGKHDVPCEIHMPTILEPWFAIKDYGTGLSPENLPKIYDYGDSDKNESDDEIGGFGMGSKTPLALTDQFTVTSRWNGTAYTHQVFIQNNGAPGCVQLDARDTDEPNGLTVHIALDPDSVGYADFRQALRKIVPYLPTTPTITGMGEETIEQLAYQTEIIDPSNIPGITKIGLAQTDYQHLTVVQGIVPYTVRNADIYDRIDWNAQPEGLHHLAKKVRVVLHADIGTYEVTVSRESLSLTHDVLTRLKDAYVKALHHVLDRFNDDITTATHYYDWALACRALGLLKPTTCPKRAAKYILKPGDREVRVDLLHQHHPNVRFSGIYRYYRKSKRRFETYKGSALDERTFDAHDIYARPKATTSVARFATQHFTAEIDPKPLMVFNGTVADVNKMLADLGIPKTATEVPYIAPPKNNNRAAFGQARYDAVTAQKDTNGQWYSRKHFKPANEIADELLPEASHALVIGKDQYHVGIYDEILAEGLNKRVLLANGDVDNLLIVQIPDAHTRKRQAFLALAEEQGVVVIHHPKEICKTSERNIRRLNNQLYGQVAYSRVRELVRKLSDNVISTLLTTPRSHPLHRIARCSQKLKEYQGVDRLHALTMSATRTIVGAQAALDHRDADPGFKAYANDLVNTIRDELANFGRTEPALQTWFDDLERGYSSVTSREAYLLALYTNTLTRTEKQQS